MITLAVGALIATWVGVVVIWPLVMTLLMNLFGIVGVVMGVVGSIFLLFNPTFRNVVGNGFRLIMRKVTGILVEIDPIGILKNTRDKMQENCAKLGKAVGNVSGALQLVTNRININISAIDKATGIKERADKDMAKETNPMQRQRYALSRSMQLQEIGRRLKSNEKLGAIKAQTTKMYGMLTRWQDLADYNVQNMTAEITNAEAERKTILAAYAGMGLAQRIIKGDPEQLRMMDASLEYLEQSNSEMLGEIDDFARYSDKYLTQMDLEQGASADQAEQMLARYESKLLSAGAPAETVPAQMPQSEGVLVARKAAASEVVDADYLDV